MADTQSTTKFRADISQLKKEMQAASRAVRLASAEFKAATAGMDDWSSSADGLQAKLKQLNKTLDGQKKILELQKRELEATIAAYGENSAAADRVRTAIYNQEAQIAKTEKQLKQYGDALGDTAEDTFDLKEALEDAGEAAEQASDGFTVAKGILANLAAEGIKVAVDALKDMAKAAVETGMAFESEMSKVEAISGASASEMERLNDKAKEMGSSTVFTAEEAGQAFEYMAMAGWKTEEMLDGIEGIMNLAAASGADLGEASDIVTDALTAMGYSAEDAGRLADVMAAASSNANTNVKLMGETFKYVAPIVGALGYDMEDTAVAIGLMANAGIKGEKAGTALRSILTRLSAPPKECAEEMEKLGLSLTDSEGNMKDMSVVIEDLRKAFDGMTETEQTAAAKHIAGQEAMSGLLAIINAAPEDFEKLTQAIDDSEGAAASMAATMQDNLQGSVTKFKSAAEGLGIAVYEGMSEPMSELVDFVTDTITKITDAITPEESRLGDFLAEVEASIDATESAIATARQTIEAGELDATRLETYKNILIETNGAQDEFSQYQIKAIVDELAGAVPELAAAWDENTRSLRLTNDEIAMLIGNQEQYVLQQSKMEALSTAMKAYTDAQVDSAKAQSAFNQALREVNEEAGREFSSLEEVAGYYSQTGVAITDTYNRLIEANGQLQESNTNIEEAKELYDLTDQALKEMDATIGQTSDRMAEASGSADELASNTDNLGSSASDSADAYEEAGGRIADSAEAQSQAASDAAKETAKEMDTAGKESGEQFASAIESTESDSEAAGTGVAESAKSGLESVSTYESGQYFGQGYINGIGSMVQQAYNEAYTLAQKAWEGLRAGQQEGSPSKLTTKSGTYFTQGYIKGITKLEGQLVKAVGKLAESAVTTLAKANGRTAEAIGATASEQFINSISEKTDYIMARIEYANSKKSAEFDKQIEKLNAKSEAKTAKIKSASNKKVEKLQAQLNKASSKSEKERLRKQIKAEQNSAKKLVDANEAKYKKLIDTQKKYREAYRTASGQMLSELNKSFSQYSQAAQDLVDSTINGITDRYTSGIETLEAKQDQLTEKLIGAGTLYDISAAGVMTVNNIEEQTRQIKEYSDRLAKIRSRVSGELFDEIATFDIKEGAAYIDRLLAMSAEDLDAYNSAYTEKLKAAQEAGQSIYKSDFENLAQEYKSEIDSALAGIEDDLKDLGVQAMRGFVDGLTKNTDYMDKNVKTFVNAMLKTFKTQLKIHSPSKVTFGLGEFTGEGFNDGLMSTVRQIQSTIRRITGEVSSPIRGFGAELSGVRQSVNGYSSGGSAGASIVNNYNLVQNNTSPKSLSALETYQARRQQIAMIKAMS